MRRRLRDNRGQAAAEMAMVLPVFLLVLLAIVEFGMIFQQYVTLTDAVREGARKAAVARHRPDRVTHVKAAVVLSGTDLGPSFTQADVGVTSTWEPGGDVEVTASHPYSFSLLGLVVRSGTMTSTTTERVE